MSEFKNYSSYVKDEALSFVDQYIDELIGDIEEGNTDVGDFIDDYRLHEWCDNDFIYVDLMDSAYILDQSDNVETDSGLWESQEPREAIKTQAFFTYKNDMYLEIREVITQRLNDHIAKLGDELEQLQSELDELQEADYDDLAPAEQERHDKLEERISDLEDCISNTEDAIESM